jgi:type II secretory ATPase GspE/PulE/Tfp pilus assembly ATPase PilB-like protein
VTLLYGDVGAAALDDEPAIRAVDEIFSSALSSNASDVHIEPWGAGGRVRERVDGVLRHTRDLSRPLLGRVSSRIKLLAGMDIADRRTPQDGRYALERNGISLDARVASMPTIAGERLAIRLLDLDASAARFERLGMPDGMAATLRGVLNGSSGFIAMCGPTGSGKSTTLYSALSERNAVGTHVCSVEDPVEVRLRGIAQVQVNVRSGLTFATALRAFLRQDPDVISIGELRDAETAAAACSAALSGQLVLTTLHARDAVGSIERLRELGMSRRGIASALSAVVAQRLVRRLCEGCKVVDGFADARSGGCGQCAGTGYRGRIGVFELLACSDAVRENIEAGSPSHVLRAAAAASGYQPMSAAAAWLVDSHQTTAGEALRALPQAAA